MSANLGEDAQETRSQESSVCVGDGNTCVECGKVFTHPFYFSTHISSHTSEKGFVVIGQCALCGLVFSDADMFAAHLNSSQTRLEKQQVVPEEASVSVKDCSNVKSKVASRVAAAVKKKSTDIKLEIIDQEDIKVEMHSPQPSEVKATGKEITDSNDEARAKRKRKAPQRYEVDSGPQLATSRVAADPEVEAYLLSLKQMGLTVDPEAFSSGSKRRRKVSEGSGGKGRARRDFMLAEDLTVDVLLLQKPSPKYEYLDSDDSFDENPEVLPESGKMTRGQRLQQRQERLSQGKSAGADKKPDIVKLEVTGDTEKDDKRTDTPQGIDVEKQNKPVVPQTKPNASATAVKPVQSTSTPVVIKREKPPVAAPYFAGSVGRVPQWSNPRGRGRGAITQPNIGKPNTVRANHTPPFAGRSSQYRAFSMPNTSHSNVYQPRSAVANNSGSRPVRFPQAQVRERKGDAEKLQSALNAQKTNSLEDLKKNSRDNVEMMLQSVGMIAVASSAMGQGKIFGTEKTKLYPPAKNVGGTNLRQPGHPYGGFMNKPFSPQKTLPSQQSASYRGQSRFGSGFRGRLPAHPQPYRGHPAAQSAHGQGFGLGAQRGRGQQLSNSMRGSMRGRGSNLAARGGVVSASNSMRGSMRGRGSNLATRGGLASASSNIRGSVRGRGSNLAARGNMMSATNPVRSMASSRGGAAIVNKQVKPVQASSDVIVIDDDEIQEIAAGPSGVLSAGSSRARNLSPKTPKSSTARGSKGEVAILDVDMDSLKSDIKIIEDKTQGVTSPAGSADLQDGASLEQPPLDDVDDNDDDVESKHVSRENSHDSLKAESESLEAAVDVQPTGGNDSCPGKVTDDVDILPGEDIDGWKVCLAEDSDTNDDPPSPQPSTSKSSSKDHIVTPAGSPQRSCSSPQRSEAGLEDLPQTDSSCQPGTGHAQKVEHNDSQLQDDTVCQSVLATTESQVEPADSESLNDTKHDSASEMMCHKQDIFNDDNEFAPGGANENQTEDTKSELPGPGKDTFQEGGNKADFDDVLQELKNENSSSVSHTDQRAEEDVEDADECMQTALTASTTIASTIPVTDSSTGDQSNPIIPDSSGESSLALSPDNAVLSDKEKSYNRAGADPTDCETAVEEGCFTNTDFETSSATTLPESGIPVADTEPGLSCAYTSNGGSSDQAEVDSVAPPSKNDMSLENDSAHSDANNSKSTSETEAESASLPAGSSDAITSENSAESAHNTFSSHSPASHSCPATAADCIRDDSNLLDIFTEIEKTCKEMEQTLDSEADKKSAALTEKMDVSRVVADLSGDLEVEKEEAGFNGVLKVAERSNGVAFSDSGSDVAVKESRSGDCRFSDMIYEKEVIDNGNVSSMDEEHNTSEHGEKDVTGNEFGM